LLVTVHHKSFKPNAIPIAGLPASRATILRPTKRLSLENESETFRLGYGVWIFVVTAEKWKGDEHSYFLSSFFLLHFGPDEGKLEPKCPAQLRCDDHLTIEGEGD
jgi:hypothetical protein